jgi:hypothetical protein
MALFWPGHSPAISRGRVVEARAALRRVDIAAALREAVRAVGRGAGGVLGEPGGRGRGGGEGGEDRVEVGLERAAARVVHVARAVGEDAEPEVIGISPRRGEAEREAEHKERDEAVHGSWTRLLVHWPLRARAGCF